MYHCSADQTWFNSNNFFVDKYGMGSIKHTNYKHSHGIESRPKD